MDSKPSTRKKCPRSTHTSTQAIYIYFIAIKGIHINVHNFDIQQVNNVAWSGAYLCLPITNWESVTLFCFNRSK